MQYNLNCVESTVKTQPTYWFVCLVSSEHRNMPLESAMSMILRNFEEWLANSGDVATEPRQTGRQAPSLDFQRPDDNLVRMLRMVIDGRCLVVEELDEVIGYFQQRRDAMAKAQGIAPASKSVSSGLYMYTYIHTPLNTTESSFPVYMV